MAVLRGEGTEKTPFTVYSDKLPACAVERRLRNRGLCPVQRITSYKVSYPNVKVTENNYFDAKGNKQIRTIYSTPKGDLTTLHHRAVFTDWWHERMFKTPNDYKSLLFMIKDAVVQPDYETAAQVVADLGDDFVVRDQVPLEPLQAFITGTYMAMETFCMEWMDNRDEILKLVDAYVEFVRKIYPIAAAGPLDFANYGGNVVPQVIGEQVFREYYIPHYNEAAEIFHNHGKLLGTHLDAENTPIMKAIGETDLDYIEAYDPGISPSVGEALKTWPDKVLWINWPSAWHLKTEEEVRECTRQMIREASPGNRFIIGITEDVPAHRWRGNFEAIMDGIDAEASR